MKRLQWQSYHNEGDTMEDNFRNALIIISAVVIGAIFVHGLWTIRKNKNPYKLKTSDEPVANDDPVLDKSGFDQYGVSAPRVVEHSALTGEIKNPPKEEEIPQAPAPAPSFNDEPLPQDLKAKDPHVEIEQEDIATSQYEPPRVEEEVTVEEPVVEPAIVEQEEETPAVTEETSQKIEQTIALEPLYETPVTQPKVRDTSAEKPKPIKKARTTKAEKEALKRNQMGFNFGDIEELETAQSEPSLGEPFELEQAPQEPKIEPDSPAKVEVEPEVLIISVVMPDNHLMSGAALLPSLLTLGLKYGDMNIFHRHQDNAGNGKVTFSLANMLNPGTFDLDAMESFATQGVSLFMTLPNAGDPFEVFNQMMAAARHLSQEFNAQILDDKRCVMTAQTEQHYMTKIREFDRKHRIAQK